MWCHITQNGNLQVPSSKPQIPHHRNIRWVFGLHFLMPNNKYFCWYFEQGSSIPFTQCKVRVATAWWWPLI
jgi:hypothetical protein